MLKRKDARLRDWNIRIIWDSSPWICKVEKKRCSITRLKQVGLRMTFHIHSSWKEKMLDYEIETEKMSKITGYAIGTLKRKDARLRDWNGAGRVNRIYVFCELKRKDARLRDWNVAIQCFKEPLTEQLKRKDARLRDWNGQRLWKTSPNALRLKRKDARLRDWNKSNTSCVHRNSNVVEKKRCSITRLKHKKSQNLRLLVYISWKEKMLDYEIET